MSSSERVLKAIRFWFGSPARTRILTLLATCASYALVSVVCFRNFISNPGTIGHTWDWPIPSAPVALHAMSQVVFSAWNNQFGGFANSYGTSSLVYTSLVGFLGLMMGGAFASKLLVVLATTLSAVTMFFLVCYFTGESAFSKKTPIPISAYFAGLFYGFGPVMFNEMTAGAFTQFISYGFIPLAFICFDRALISHRSVDVWATVLFMSVVAMSLQNLYLLSFLLLVWGLSRAGLRSIATDVKVLAMFAMVNLWWILPTVQQLQYVMQVTSSRSITYLHNLEFNVPSMVEGALGVGWWVGGTHMSFFLNAISGTGFRILLLSIAALGVVIGLSALVLRPRESTVGYWCLIYVVAVLVDTGLHSPVASFVLTLYAYMPGFSYLFASPQHLIWPSIFSLAVLMGLSWSRLSQLCPKHRRAWVLLMVLVVGVSISPFLAGNISEGVGLFSSPPGYDAMLRYVGSNSGPYERMLFLPMSHSPLYLRTPFQRQAQGGDPNVLYSPVPTLVTDTIANPIGSRIANYIEGAIAGPMPQNISKILSTMGIKYIILRHDVVPNFGTFSGRSGGGVADWNVSLIQLRLSSERNIRLIQNSTFASLWMNTLPVTPWLYAATNVTDDPPWSDIGGYWDRAKDGSVLGMNGFEISNVAAPEHYNYTVVFQLLEASEDTYVVWGFKDTGDFYFAGISGSEHFVIGKSTSGVWKNMVVKDFELAHEEAYQISILGTASETYVIGRPMCLSCEGTKFSSRIRYDTTISGSFGVFSPQVTRYRSVDLADGVGQVLLDRLCPETSVLFDDSFVLGGSATVDLHETSPSRKKMVQDLNASARVHLQPVMASTGEYVMDVNATEPFMLVFNQNFNSQWKVFYGGESGGLSLFQRQPLPESSHFLVNTFANGWLLDRTGSFKITLKFVPDLTLQLGTYLSIFFVACTLIVAAARSEALKFGAGKATEDARRFHKSGV